MSRSGMLARACQARQGALSLLYRHCSVLTTQISRSSTKAVHSKDISINNVVEDRPVKYFNKFNHERKRRPELTVPQPKIVIKKKDQEISLYPSLEERLLGK